MKRAVTIIAAFAAAALITVAAQAEGQGERMAPPKSSMSSFKALPKADMDALPGCLKTLK